MKKDSAHRLNKLLIKVFYLIKKLIHMLITLAKHDINYVDVLSTTSWAVLSWPGCRFLKQAQTIFLQNPTLRALSSMAAVCHPHSHSFFCSTTSVFIGWGAESSSFIIFVMRMEELEWYFKINTVFIITTINNLKFLIPYFF